MAQPPTTPPRSPARSRWHTLLHEDVRKSMGLNSSLFLSGHRTRLGRKPSAAIHGAAGLPASIAMRKHPRASGGRRASSSRITSIMSMNDPNTAVPDAQDSSDEEFGKEKTMVALPPADALVASERRRTEACRTGQLDQYLLFADCFSCCSAGYVLINWTCY